MIGSIILGAVIGWAASKLMRTKSGMFLNVILGIAGSAVGNFLASCVGISATNSIGGLLIGVAGACVLILGFRWLTGKKGGKD